MIGGHLSMISREQYTVVLGRGKAKGCVVKFVERQTRLYLTILMQDCSASLMELAVRKDSAVLPKQAVKIVATDYGNEFSC